MKVCEIKNHTSVASPVFCLIWIRQKNKKYLIADVTSEQGLNASLYASIQCVATTGTDAIRYFLFFVRHSNKSGFYICIRFLFSGFTVISTDIICG